MIPWYPRRVSLLIREGLSEWKGKSQIKISCAKKTSQVVSMLFKLCNGAIYPFC